MSIINLLLLWIIIPPLLSSLFYHPVSGVKSCPQWTMCPESDGESDEMKTSDRTEYRTSEVPCGHVCIPGSSFFNREKCNCNRVHTAF